MGTETTELTEVQTVIDGLSSPTDEQFVQAVRGYSDGAVASAAAKLALEGGGGGGGSLPAWWTVDSTPDAENVAFAGEVHVDTAGRAGATTFEASTDLNGDGLGFYLSDIGGETKVQAAAHIIDLSDQNFSTMIQIGEDSIGFFGHTTTPRPTGVAVTAAGIHAALVSLGLITA